MIFYFSGTGNTRWLAHALGEATCERVIDIAKALDDDTSYQLTDGERLGFCFPVHGWRPPFLVRQFVRRLRLENAQGHFCYAFATCGDDVGLTFEYFQKDLAAIGLHADSVFSIIMPESYLFPFVDAIDKPEIAELKKQKARETLPTLLPYIINKVKGKCHINASRWPRINSHVLGAVFRRYCVTDKPFAVAPDRCLRCGHCAKVCPVGNISISECGVPQWLHTGRCTTCFACYHRCPAHAVTYGTRTALNHRQYKG